MHMLISHASFVLIMLRGEKDKLWPEYVVTYVAINYLIEINK